MIHSYLMLLACQLWQKSVKTKGSNRFDIAISENKKLTNRFLIGLIDILMEMNGNISVILENRGSEILIVNMSIRF